MAPAGFAGYWLVRTDEIACAPAKCGSMSLRAAIYGGSGKLADTLARVLARGIEGPFSPWEAAPRPGRRFLGVRDPVERFGSLWRDKCGRDRPTSRYPNLWRISPNELLDYIEAYPLGDSHWFPQSVYRVPGACIVRYDQLTTILGLEAVRINRTRSRDMPALPVDRIRRHYAADVALWEIACSRS